MYLECNICKLPFEVVQIHRRHETAFKNLNSQVKYCPFCGRSLTATATDFSPLVDYIEEHGGAMELKPIEPSGEITARPIEPPIDDTK